MPELVGEGPCRLARPRHLSGPQLHEAQLHRLHLQEAQLREPRFAGQVGRTTHSSFLDHFARARIGGKGHCSPWQNRENWEYRHSVDPCLHGRFSDVPRSR